MSNEAWVNSSDPEYFNGEEYPTKQKAIDAAPHDFDLESGDVFYVGKKRSYIFPTPNASEYFSNQLESDHDSLGDHSESWEMNFCKKTEIIGKIQIMLDNITDLIMSEYPPTFFLVDDCGSFKAP